MTDRESQLAYFIEIMNEKPKTEGRRGIQSSREAWNECAEKWEESLETDAIRKKRSEKRVSETSEFLRSHGILTENDTAIDIGCGPGRFVTEFARTAKHVTGTDISDRMLDYGAAYAKSQGVTNVDFKQCDFVTADIDELGWRGAYDLVYSCITPAVNSPETIRKAMDISRGWCFNGGFLVNHSGLLDDVSENVFSKKYHPKPMGRYSYALFNLLWLWGYSPYVAYYTEDAINRFQPDRMFAGEVAADLGFSRDDTESVDKIYRFLNERAEEKGELLYPHKCRYIWLLWDVRFRINR